MVLYFQLKRIISAIAEIEFKGVINLVIIGKQQFAELVKSGLIKFDKYNKNFTTINRQKKSHRHKYAVVETKQIMAKLREMNVNV